MLSKTLSELPGLPHRLLRELVIAWAGPALHQQCAVGKSSILTSCFKIAEGAGSACQSHAVGYRACTSGSVSGMLFDILINSLYTPLIFAGGMRAP